MFTESGGGILTDFISHSYSAEGQTPLKLLAVQKMIRLAQKIKSHRDWIASFPQAMGIDLSMALLDYQAKLPVEYRKPKLSIKMFEVKKEEKLSVPKVVDLS